MITMTEFIIILAFTMVVTFVFSKMWNHMNYKIGIRVLKDEGFTKGQAIDYLDNHPEIWKELTFIKY